MGWKKELKKISMISNKCRSQIQKWVLWVKLIGFENTCQDPQRSKRSIKLLNFSVWVPGTYPKECCGNFIGVFWFPLKVVEQGSPLKVWVLFLWNDSSDNSLKERHQVSPHLQFGFVDAVMFYRLYHGIHHHQTTTIWVRRFLGTFIQASKKQIQVFNSI